MNAKQPEITIKFNEPIALPEQGAKATIELITENGIKAIVTLNRKNAAKQMRKVEGFEDWIGAISGKLESVEGGQIEISNAGLQVFEKKKKAVGQS